jgi:hypothetical protein
MLNDLMRLYWQSGAFACKAGRVKQQQQSLLITRFNIVMHLSVASGSTAARAGVALLCRNVRAMQPGR